MWGPRWERKEKKKGPVTQQAGYLLLAALIAGTLHAGQATVLGVGRGICPLVKVDVMVVVVVVVEEAGRAAVDGAPFAFGRAAVQTLAPHTSRELRALHGRTGTPGGCGEMRRCRSGAEWVPDSRDGTGRCQIGCWPRQFARWQVRSRGCDGERIGGEKADLRKAGVFAQASLVPRRAGLVPRAGGAFVHTEF